MLTKTIAQIEKELKEKGIKDYNILEGSNLIWVSTPKGTYKYLKPRKHKEVIEILKDIVPLSPLEGLLKVLINPIKNKAYKSVKYFLKSKERNLLLLGSVGAGKTSCSLYVIYTYLKFRKITKPLYFSVLTDLGDREFYTNLKKENYDCFMIDDLNISAGQFRLNIAMEIMLYALERKSPLFITSNNSYEELSKLFGQHLRSRIDSSSLIIEVKDKDFRREV